MSDDDDVSRLITDQLQAWVRLEHGKIQSLCNDTRKRSAQILLSRLSVIVIQECVEGSTLKNRSDGIRIVQDCSEDLLPRWGSLWSCSRFESSGRLVHEDCLSCADHCSRPAEQLTLSPVAESCGVRVGANCWEKAAAIQSAATRASA